MRLRRTPLQVAIAAGFASVALCFDAPAFSAAEVVTVAHLPFKQRNINVWGSGPAYYARENMFLGLPEFNVDIPSKSITPYALLADAVGLPLPELGFADIGANARGRVGYRFQYEITGGSLDIDYPARVMLRATTLDGQPGRIAAGEVQTLETTFDPGMAMDFVAVTAPCYDDTLLRCARRGAVLVETRRAPNFTTKFPSASASMSLEIDVAAGAVARVGVFKAGDACYLCKRATVSFPVRKTIELMSLGVDKLAVVGPCGTQDSPLGLGLCELPLSNREIPLFGGYLRFNYPKVEVTRARLSANGRQLTGGDTKPIVEFSASLEKLFPIIGPFLSNDAAFAKYMLFETTAGPSLSLSQHFKLDVTPIMRLGFGRTVEVERGGSWQRVTFVEETIGTPVRWRPLKNEQGAIVLRPEFRLDARFENRTGVALGYNLNVRALTIAAGPAKLGPALDRNLSNLDLIEGLVPIPFEIQLPRFAGEAIALEIVHPIKIGQSDIGQHLPPDPTGSLVGGGIRTGPRSTAPHEAYAGQRAVTAATAAAKSISPFVVNAAGERLYITDGDRLADANKAADIVDACASHRDACQRSAEPTLRLPDLLLAEPTVRVEDASTTTVDPRVLPN